jgi:2-polyprenyl-3-methyl-5-hydroxy-6-metoxy-1,4-benzoquinol methylase
VADNVVDNYGWTRTEGPHSCGYIAPKIVSLLVGLGAQRVVDIGAGNGALCGLIAKAGMKVVGVEYDSEGVQLAQKTHPSLCFYKAGVQDDPAHILEAQGLFDVAVSTEVIEHLFAPHLLPQFAVKLLPKGGKLIVTTPYHGYLKNLALSVAGKWDKHHTPLWHGGHIKFWSRETLGRLLQDNGFRIIGFDGVGRYAVVSQGAHLCTGTHDIHRASFQIYAKPIRIGAYAWVCAEAFVGPGVTVDEGAVLAARAVAFQNLEAWTVYVGNPAVEKSDRTRFKTAL